MKLIDRVRNSSDPADKRVWAQAHSNLIKALGEPPTEGLDPRLIESNEYKLEIVVNNQTINIDMRKWMSMDDEIKKQVTQALYGGSEIDDIQAEEIMNT